MNIIAYDLGTGGIKASLFTQDGRSLASTFVSYDTIYKEGNIHEQSPGLWWDGIITTTKQLTAKHDPSEIVGMALSGHSLGVVPVDKNGRLLRELTPIWSDARAEAQAARFFKKVSYNDWYKTTGNGFPAECYSVFKIMWYRDNEPDMFKNVFKILGSKDYCNMLLTGRMVTDGSYASGSGVFDLLRGDYRDDYIEAAGLDRGLFPDIIRSYDIVGELKPDVAELLGLSPNTKVVCGGVDNSCMALGARGFKSGRAYISLGSSSWIAVCDDKPIIDPKRKPFVFAHVIDGMYTSATSIFAAGSSFRWVRDNMCADLLEKERRGEISDAYVAMNELAESSPIGAKGLVFNPSLAGGAMIEESKNICGGFVGLNLRHDRGDIVRSALEGITYNLYYAMKILLSYTPGISEMLLVGGGSKSPFWRQMFADVFGMRMIKTSVDQDCASLGAAALAAYGLGLWHDFSPIDAIHENEAVHEPDGDKTAKYRRMYKLHRHIAHYMALAGDELHQMNF